MAQAFRFFVLFFVQMTSLLARTYGATARLIPHKLCLSKASGAREHGFGGARSKVKSFARAAFAKDMTTVIGEKRGADNKASASPKLLGRGASRTNMGSEFASVVCNGAKLGGGTYAKTRKVFALRAHKGTTKKKKRNTSTARGVEAMRKSESKFGHLPDTVAKRHKTRTPSPLCSNNKELLVGSAQEPDHIHAERHPPEKLRDWAKTCARCFYTLRKQTTTSPDWLRPKPSYMSGAWGLGCTWCAAGMLSVDVQARRRQHMSENKIAGRCKQAISRSGVWSTYGKRDLLTGRQFTLATAQHESADFHRIGQAVFFSHTFHMNGAGDPRGCAWSLQSQAASGACSASPPAEKAAPVSVPDTSTVRMVTASTGSMDDPFRGRRVPQPKDWLDIWAETVSAISTRRDFVCRCLFQIEVNKY